MDFPRHLNVGDSAIWVGERAVLQRAGVDVMAASDKFSYSPARIRRRIGDRPILIHGGGNFGDLYETHHRLRERVFADFRDRPIIQLPQSINFRTRESLARTQRLISEHGGVVIMVRDRRSLAFATEHLEAEVIFAPDAAFGIGPLARSREPDMDVVRQARTDKEHAGDEPEVTGTFDWLVPPTAGRARWESWAHEAGMWVLAGDHGRARPVHPRLTLAAYDRHAAWNVKRGTEMLSRGRVVITDRLHGHILCVLMSIPHVLLNDRYGKIRDYWDAWSHGAPGAHFAAEPEEARTIATSLC